jgi:hypothetical protein
MVDAGRAVGNMFDAITARNTYLVSDALAGERAAFDCAANDSPEEGVDQVQHAASVKT